MHLSTGQCLEPKELLVYWIPPDYKKVIKVIKKACTRTYVRIYTYRQWFMVEHYKYTSLQKQRFIVEV